MSIKQVILGFLSDSPMIGYDLKKKFSSSELFHWSGNSNQIYKALLELHDEALVSLEIQAQDNKPPRKIYTITEAGLKSLREWLQSVPALPQFQNPMLMQLNWAEQLSSEELKGVLENYEIELVEHLELLHGQAKRLEENSMQKRIAQHWLSFYEVELGWIRSLLNEEGQS